MKLETKIIIPFVVFFISLILISLVFFDFMRVTDSNFENVLNVDSRFNDFSSGLVQLSIIRDNLFENYLRSGRNVYRDRYLANIEDIGSIYKDLLEDNTNSELQQTYVQQRDVLSNIISIENDVMNGVLPRSTINETKYISLKKEYDELLSVSSIRYQQFAKKELLESLQKASLYSFVIFLLISLSAVLVVTEFIIIKRDVINPISKITNGLERLRSSKFDTRLGGDDRTEMGRLMRELDATASQVNTHLQEQQHTIKDRESMARLATEMIKSKQKPKSKGQEDKHIEDLDGVDESAVDDLKKELKEREDMLKLALLAVEQNKFASGKEIKAKRKKIKGKNK